MECLQISTGKRLDAFHRKCLGAILHITWQDKVTNEEVMKRTGAQEVQTIMKVRRMRYLGHVMRMDPQRLTHTVLEWNPIGGKRKRGRPKLTWTKTIDTDIASMGYNKEQARQAAQDRQMWRSLVARYADQHGRI